jgi:hypothetical protein
MPGGMHQQPDILVDSSHAMPLCKLTVDQMTPDESASAGDQNVGLQGAFTSSFSPVTITA